MSTRGRGRDQAAFDATFVREYVRLVRVAALICGDRAVAEEVTQEAFLAAWRAWATLENPGGYIQRSTVNGAIDVRRRRTVLNAKEATLRAARPAEEFHDVDPLEDVLDTLPGHQRAAVLLRYYDDLTVPQIAQMLDRPLNTVKSDLRLALARLSKELTP